jgi:hypothetical protein
MSEQAPGRSWSVAVFFIVAALVAYPPLIALVDHGTLGAFRYLAPDSFYYLAIADHSTNAGFFTFDGLNPTNGFHPLWQLLLEKSFSFLGLDAAGQVQFTALVSVALAALGSGLFAVAALRATGRPALALLASVPGFLFLAMPDFGFGFATQWTFANGMESPLSILLFGVLAFWMFGQAKPFGAWSTRDVLVLSALLTAITLTRLDDIFIFVPFGIVLLLRLRAEPGRRSLRQLAALCALPTAALSVYLAYNYAGAGTLLPTSGAAKSQPLWALLRNTYAVFTTLFPHLDFMREGVSVWESEAWRVAQMVVPALVALVVLFRDRVAILRGELESRRLLVALLAGYVIVKASYNFATVGLWHQGSWYFVISIMTCNLLIACLVADLLDRVPRGEGAQKPIAWGLGAQRAASFAGAAVLGLLIANSFIDQKENGKYHKLSFDFWAERDTTRALIDEHCPGCGVVSFDDGIVSYSLGNVPTLNGLGLATDKDASAAIEEGRLLDLAWARGHQLLVTVNYPMNAQAYEKPELLRAHLRRNPHFSEEQIDDWDFEVAFRSPDSTISFIRFEPRVGSRPLGQDGYVRRMPVRRRSAPITPATTPYGS